MLRSGEMENVLRKPIRESGHLPGQARRLSADELDALVAGYREGRVVEGRVVEGHNGFTKQVTTQQLRDGSDVRLHDDGVGLETVKDDPVALARLAGQQGFMSAGPKCWVERLLVGELQAEAAKAASTS